MSIQGNEPGDELRRRAARPRAPCPRRGRDRRAAARRRREGCGGGRLPPRRPEAADSAGGGAGTDGRTRWRQARARCGGRGSGCADAPRCCARRREAASERLGVPLPPADLENVADEEPESTQVPMGERLVTSLFADVRGYTQLAGSVPPEELTDRMTALYRFARAAVVSQSRDHRQVRGGCGDGHLQCHRNQGPARHRRARGGALAPRQGPADRPGPGHRNRGRPGRALAGRLGRQRLGPWRVHEPGVTPAGRGGGGEILLSEEAHRRVEGRLKDLDLHAAGEELEIKGVGGPVPAFRIGAPVTAGT